MSSLYLSFYPRAMVVCLSLMFGRSGIAISSLVLGYLIDANCVAAISSVSAIVVCKHTSTCEFNRVFTLKLLLMFFLPHSCWTSLTTHAIYRRYEEIMIKPCQHKAGYCNVKLNENKRVKIHHHDV